MELFIRSNLSLYCEGYRLSPNDKLIYEPQPNYIIKYLKAKISSQGLHDRYFSIDKPAGVYRIAVISDSVAFGWMVGAQNSFPKVLERMLNEKESGKYEVINFSVPGYNTSQEFELFKEKVIQFKPDMVILVYCQNDTAICNYFKPDVTFLSYLYNKSYLVHFLLRRVDLWLRTTRFNKIWGTFKKNILAMFYYDQLIYPLPGLEETIYINRIPPLSKKMVPKKYWYMVGFKNYKIHLSNFLNFSQKNNIKFISAGLFDNNALAINKELGIQNICNFLEFLKRDQIPYGKITLSSEDMHMNIHGHHLCASYLYSYILKKELLTSKSGK